MSAICPLPLLAGIETWIWVILVIVLPFISWLNQVITGKNQPPQAMPGRERPRRRPDPRVQSEIDKFRQMTGGRKNVRENDIDDVEIVEVVPGRKRSLTSGDSFEPLSTTPRGRVGSDIASRHVGSDDLGDGVRSHVAQHMQDGRLASQVSENLSHGVNESVQQHLGSFGDADNLEKRDPFAASDIQAAATPSAIVTLLRTPVGIRQAVLMNEILSPPLGRRKR